MGNIKTAKSAKDKIEEEALFIRAFPAKLKTDIKIMAARQRRSMAEVVIEILDSHVNKESPAR